MTTLTLEPAKPPASRMLWLDASRVMAAIGVILIHSTTDAAGEPFRSPSPWMNLSTSFVRGVAELSGAEIFLVFSLFLLAHKVEKGGTSYGAILRQQARRLLIPFLAWSLFFAFFRLFKASAFNYSPAVWTELSSVRSWVSYALFGTAQYHLHFMPTLFFVILFFPCMTMARRFPQLGLLLIPFLVCMDYLQRWSWGYFTTLPDRLAAMQVIKNLGYLGYGMAAFSLYAFWQRGFTREEGRELLRLVVLLIGVAFVTTWAYWISVASKPGWVDRAPATLLAHLVMPALVFAAFMAAQHAHWPAFFSKLSAYTFGVYLVHPIFIDVYDIAMASLGWKPSPLVCIFSKFLLAVAGAFALSYGLGKIRPLAFLIGIELSPKAQRGSPLRALAGSGAGASGR